MAPRRIEIPPGVRDKVGARALAALPEECCGVLLGRRDGDLVRVLEAREVENTHPGNREQRFSIAPKTLLRVHRAARAKGVDVVGYYHSHPSGDARPSEHDSRAAWSGCSYLIVGVSDGEIQEVRSWRLVDRRLGTGRLESNGLGFQEERIRYADRPVRREEET